MHIKGPLDPIQCESNNILAAIASSFQEDYGTDCMLFRYTKIMGMTGYTSPFAAQGATPSFVERDDFLIVIRISDFTVLCVALVPETPAGSVLHLFKAPFDGEESWPGSNDVVLLDNRKIYWERSYELASPDDFDDVIRIITTNFDEYSKWPHRAKS